MANRTGEMRLNVAQIKKDWTARGYSCEYWIDPPDQTWSDFMHDTDELVVLLEGEIELSFDGRIICPDIGEEVLIPAGSCHTVRNTGAVSNRWCFGYKIRA
jgi:mannose-6-phosphate isomerase-like protein (cupin superfamily)